MAFDPYAPPPLLTSRQMGRHLRLPWQWIEAEAKGGRLPHINANGKLLFGPGVVETVVVKLAQEVPA